MKVFSWTVVVPIVAVVLLALTWGRDIGILVQVVVAFALAAAVLAAVNHAEVVAHRVGEPFGSLVLAVAVTIIEVGLIVTLMIAGGPRNCLSGPRHGIRGGDDHLQRHRRYRTADRCSALPPHDLQRRRNRRGAGHGDHVGHLEPGAADLHARSPRARSSLPPSSPLRRSPRWPCTPSSSSHRRFGTETSSSR